MPKVINFPTKSLTDLKARVIYLKNYFNSQIIDFTRARNEILGIEKRLKQLENKAKFKLIK